MDQANSRQRFLSAPRRQIAVTIGLSLVVWWMLARLHHALDSLDVEASIVPWFPIPQFSGWSLHASGWPYILAFIAVLGLSVRFANRLTAGTTYLVGVALIVLGNLGQGSAAAAFIDPFEKSGVQYFSDAMRIAVPWRLWLGRFNDNQIPLLLLHGRTHPPFAVLIHYWILHAFGGSTAVLSAAFIFIASLSILIVFAILRAMDVPSPQRQLLAILFAVIPAVNIYTAVSLDGVILTTASIFLLGLVLIVRKRAPLAVGILLCVVGFVLTNLLTYGGTFLIGAGVLVAIQQWWKKRSTDVANAVVAAVVAFVVVMLALKAFYGYDHLQGLITASRLENPEGFRGFAAPIDYIQTRIENASEIAFFFSFGCLALLFARSASGISIRDVRRDEVVFAAAAMLTFIVILATGAFRVGEAARACMFMYPYLLLLFCRTDRSALQDVVVLAGVQTAAMQLCGSYFW